MSGPDDETEREHEPSQRRLDQARERGDVKVVVIDPRAGQGPGIGGFKPVSEVGNAFKAGHPVYAIGFELYENGISRELRLDYGDFIIDGTMSSLCAPSR